jgi:hypothetical protein
MSILGFAFNISAIAFPSLPSKVIGTPGLENFQYLSKDSMNSLNLWSVSVLLFVEGFFFEGIISG